MGLAAGHLWPCLPDHPPFTAAHLPYSYDQAIVELPTIYQHSGIPRRASIILRCPLPPPTQRRAAATISPQMCFCHNPPVQHQLQHPTRRGLRRVYIAFQSPVDGPNANVHLCLCVEHYCIRISTNCAREYRVEPIYAPPLSKYTVICDICHHRRAASWMPFIYLSGPTTISDFVLSLRNVNSTQPTTTPLCRNSMVVYTLDTSRR